ncbi:MAG TPA: hypothetical protein PKE27_03000 [Povalibacter sp.]|nr:hypothetical protein [Povalibacter sp.]HMN43509.1 hypothetical protein [Povalibacter sp.]
MESSAPAALGDAARVKEFLQLVVRPRGCRLRHARARVNRFSE